MIESDRDFKWFASRLSFLIAISFKFNNVFD